MSYSDKNSRSIRKICLVSSALFNLTACVYNWTAPIGAALGCVASLTNDIDSSLSNELQETIDEAFRLTKQNSSSSSQLMILDELVNSEITLDNFYELIQETEAFQVQYCTDSDADEIFGRFEMYFRECVSQHPNLSRLYILSSGMATLEQLKKYVRLCMTSMVK